MTTPREPTAEIVRRNIIGMLFLTGKTQKDLAEAMRLNQGNVSRKLTAITRFDLNDLDLASKFFGVSVADIVTPGCMPIQSMILDAP